MKNDIRFLVINTCNINIMKEFLKEFYNEWYGKDLKFEPKSIEKNRLDEKDER